MPLLLTASGVALVYAIASGRLPLQAGLVAAVGALLLVILITGSERWILETAIALAVFESGGGLRTRYTLIDASLLAIFVCLIIYGLKARSQLPLGKTFTALTIAFITLVTINSARFGIDPIMLAWLMGFLLVVAALKSPGLGNPTRTIAVVVATMTVSCTLDLQLELAGGGRDLGAFNTGRFGGLLADYELSAEYYAMTVALSLLLMIVSRHFITMLLCLLPIVVGVFLLLQTQSRSPALLLSVCVVVLLAWGIRHSAFRRRSLLLTGAITSAVFMGATALTATNLYGRIVGTSTIGDLADVLNRSTVWQYVMSLPSFQQAGLLGNGYSYPYQTIGTYPHSLYLWWFWAGGVLGLAVFVALIIAILLRLFKAQGTFVAPSMMIVIALCLDQIKIEAARTQSSILFLMGMIAFAVILAKNEGGERYSEAVSTRNSQLLAHTIRK